MEVEEPLESVTEAKKSRGMFSMLQSLVGSKAIEAEELTPVLDKMKDHLISKNVAADIAAKLCESVRAKLEGKVRTTSNNDPFLEGIQVQNGQKSATILLPGQWHTL